MNDELPKKEPILIKITEVMKLQAYRLANALINQKRMKETPNYTGREIQGRFHLGCLAEQVCIRYFCMNNIKFIYAPKIGEADHGDYIFFIKGKKVIGDTKGIFKNSKKLLLIDAWKYNKTKYAYYFGVRINDDIGELWGFDYKEDFKLNENGFDKHERPTMWDDFWALRDMPELLKQLDKGDHIIEYSKYD